MHTIKFFSLILIFLLLATGCAGNYGKFKRKTGNESKATKRELIDNWSDYDIWLGYYTAYDPPRLITTIFDAKNDGKKILVEDNRSIVKVKDQEMWTEVVKEHTTIDGEFVLLWGSSQETEYTGVQEIWGPDNQLYGFIIYQEYAAGLDRIKLVDKNTIFLYTLIGEWRGGSSFR